MASLSQGSKVKAQERVYAHKYYLGATHFEYALNGEEVVTMKNAAEVHTGGILEAMSVFRLKSEGSMSLETKSDSMDTLMPPSGTYVFAMKFP